MQKCEDVGLEILVEVASRAPLTGVFDDSCPDRNLVLVGKFIGLCQAIRITLSALYAQTFPNEGGTTKKARVKVECTTSAEKIQNLALKTFRKLPCETAVAVIKARDAARLCATSRTKFAHGYWGREENAANARIFISFAGKYSDSKNQPRMNRPEKWAEVDALSDLNNEIAIASDLLRWMHSHLPAAGWANSTISSSIGATTTNSSC
jgi:hypothetical protein